MADRVFTIEDIKNPHRPWNTSGKSTEVKTVKEGTLAGPPPPPIIRQPLMAGSVEVTFFKIWLVLWLICSTWYAILQGNKEKYYRDDWDDAVKLLIIFICLTGVFTLFAGVLIEAPGIHRLPIP